MSPAPRSWDQLNLMRSSLHITPPFHAEQIDASQLSTRDVQESKHCRCGDGSRRAGTEPFNRGANIFAAERGFTSAQPQTAQGSLPAVLPRRHTHTRGVDGNGLRARCCWSAGCLERAERRTAPTHSKTTRDALTVSWGFSSQIALSRTTAMRKGVPGALLQWWKKLPRVDEKVAQHKQNTREIGEAPARNISSVGTHHLPCLASVPRFFIFGRWWGTFFLLI